MSEKMTEAQRLDRIAKIIESVDNRCMAADGPVTPTLQEMTRAEALVKELWQDLLEKDDRTSPEEYPDMALITFDEFRAAVLAAIPPDSGRGGWRPIETAPKDGTPVDVWVKWVDGEGRFPDARWDNGQWRLMFPETLYASRPTITHWQPLPPAPGAATRVSEVVLVPIASVIDGWGDENRGSRSCKLCGGSWIATHAPAHKKGCALSAIQPKETGR